MVKIKVKLDPGAVMPTRATSGSVGYDVKSLKTYIVRGDGTELPMMDEYDCLSMQKNRIDIAKIKIDTGVHVQPEPGYYVELVPNSRIAKTSFVSANSIGIIDPDYTGSIRAVFDCVNNVSAEELERFIPYNVIGQLIIRKKHDAYLIPVNSLDDTERGDGGFGSTDRDRLDYQEWYR